MKLYVKDERVQDIIDEIEPSIRKRKAGYCFNFVGNGYGYYSLRGMLKIIAGLCNWRLDVLEENTKEHYEIKNKHLMLSTAAEPLFNWTWQEWRFVNKITIDKIGIAFSWKNGELGGLYTCHWSQGVKP